MIDKYLPTDIRNTTRACALLRAKLLGQTYVSISKAAGIRASRTRQLIGTTVHYISFLVKADKELTVQQRWEKIRMFMNHKVFWTYSLNDYEANKGVNTRNVTYPLTSEGLEDLILSYPPSELLTRHNQLRWAKRLSDASARVAKDDNVGRKRVQDGQKVILEEYLISIGLSGDDRKSLDSYSNFYKWVDKQLKIVSNELNTYN